MSWVWWLLAPLLATIATAVITWFVGRPRRALTSEQAVHSHRRFLDDLADASTPARRMAEAPRTQGPPGPAAPDLPSAVRLDKLPE